MVTLLPRVVITAPGSGHGKTTIASGLMAALRHEGLEVAGFKIGPDYIDPGYHFLATGRPGRNLDPYLCGEDRIVPLLLHGALTPTPADVAIIEGVMGLFDGQLGGDGFASTAHVARLTASPTIAVIDVSHASRTVAAVVHGLATFDPDVRLDGVIINKSGSSRHTAEVCRALEATGIPVLGVLPRGAGIAVPSRHLGLVPAAERTDSQRVLDRLAEQLAAQVDLRHLLAIAHRASPLTDQVWDPMREVIRPQASPRQARPIVAVAGGRAFTFRYAETDELLRAAGCDPVIFDPLHDQQLPAGTAGIYLGGGFPEVHATELAANTGLLADVRAAIGAGIPVVAECAGLLYLCRELDGTPLVGALPLTAAMGPRLTLGYRSAVADHEHLLAVAGQRITGHEFHRTQVIADPGTSLRSAWLLKGTAEGVSTEPSTQDTPQILASYLHTHWAGHPGLAQRFADAVRACAARGVSWAAPTVRPRSVVEPDLHHHGDQDIAEGLIDLAVNVRLRRPPSWLADLLRATIDDLADYPRTEAARAAIAAAHDVPDDHVLPTSGGAEAFTLLARALEPALPVVVHPQFTEPEAALLAAGHRPRRVITSATDDFRLDPSAIPERADLIMIGNPTNPTSVLHPRELIIGLLRPGRVVCVDEAFMDAVPGEPESLVAKAHPGLVVLRSLTKTWGLAGLRAGYAVGDPDVLGRMRGQQPPWSVSTPALAAIVACLQPEALAAGRQAALDIGRQRDELVHLLRALDLPPIAPAAAPFVLVDSHRWRRADQPPGSVRMLLRDHGFAVRRGDTFPGLGPDWFRIAVRDLATTQALGQALTAIRSRLAPNQPESHITADL